MEVNHSGSGIEIPSLAERAARPTNLANEMAMSQSKTDVALRTSELLTEAQR
jgi:hypothetical protein